jgi:hypothetical protein
LLFLYLVNPIWRLFRSNIQKIKMIIEIIGWIGAGCVIWAYYLISSGKANNKNQLYQWLNMIGAILLIINTISLMAYPSAFVNVVWLVIAVLGLMKKG